MAIAARDRLVFMGYDNVGYDNVTVYEAEAMLGYMPDAPYDAIIISAGAPKLPLKLISEQLANRGRLVVPIGSHEGQDLMKVVKSKEGYTARNLGACRFVSLIGEDAWPTESPKTSSF